MNIQKRYAKNGENIVVNMQNFQESVVKMEMCARGKAHKGGTPFIEMQGYGGMI